MGFFEDASADALSILGEIGKDITVTNTPGGSPVAFKCLISQPMVMQDLETGGFLNSTSFEVKVLRTDSDAQPGVFAFGSIVTYNGEQFRIVALANRPPSAWLIAKVQSKAQ